MSAENPNQSGEPTEPIAPAPSQNQVNQPTPSGPDQLVYPDLATVNEPPDQQGQPAEADDSEDSPSGVKTVLLGLLNWIVIPVVIVLILHNFVFQSFHVIGTSMVPTLHDTDYLIISKLGVTEADIAKAFGHSSTYIPKRDQVIVFHYPKDPTLVFIKRVIALPGERVVVSNGTVTVYNKEHPEGFNPDLGSDRTGYPTLGDIDEVVPPGNVFVLGDNRSPNGSFDSRDWGFLPSSYIIGDTVVRLWPVAQAGLF
jgi:signal peptidase I